MLSGSSDQSFDEKNASFSTSQTERQAPEPPQIELTTDSNNISHISRGERSSLYDVDDSNSFSRSRILPKLVVHTDLNFDSEVMNILHEPSPRPLSPQSHSTSFSPTRLNHPKVLNSGQIPILLDEDIDSDISKGLNLALGETGDNWMPLNESTQSLVTEATPRMRTGNSNDLESGNSAIELSDMARKSSELENPNNTSFLNVTSVRSKSSKNPKTPTTQISSVFRKFSQRLNARGDENDDDIDTSDDIDLSERLDDISYEQDEYSDYEEDAFSTHPKNPLMNQQSLQTTMRLSTHGADSFSGDSDDILPPEPPRLFGKSLKIFGPDSKFRMRCYKIVTNARYDQLLATLLIVQLSLLTYQQWDVVRGYVHNKSWTWVDLILVVPYAVYTIDVFMKSVAFGFFDDSQMFRELKIERKRSLLHRYLKTASEKLGFTHPYVYDEEQSPKDFRTVTVHDTMPDKMKPTRAFLRSDWQKIDFVSVVSFWVSVFLIINRADITHGCMIFRSLMCLRILRLLNLTHGTRLILKSLRKAGHQAAGPSLVLFVFWVLMAMIGVQSFKSSLRRHCVWTNPDDPTDIFENSMQFCGSYLDSSTNKSKPYIDNLGSAARYAKGYTCPKYSKCIAGDNPYGNTIGFDNIFIAMQMVFVIISANTFTDIMYYTMDSDEMASALFFIFSIFILTVWLLSLIVAVVINCYRVHIDDMKTSSKYTKTQILFWEFDFRGMSEEYNSYLMESKHLRNFCSLRDFFTILVIVDLGYKASVNPNFTDDNWHHLKLIEFGTTLTLFLETVIKMVLFGRNIKLYFYSISNIFDLFLAIATMIITNISLERLGDAYGWLEVIFVLRFYRVVIMLGFMTNAWKAVFSNIRPFIDLGVFFLLVNYLVGVIYSRFFEGIIPIDEYLDSDQLIMYNLPNVVLSLYTITTTENWTSILYLAQQCSSNTFTKMCVAIYLIAWFIFSNMVLLNIFIAIITQNLGVTDSNKKKMQIKQFYSKLVTELNSHKHVGLFDDLKNQWFKSNSSNKRVLTTSQMIGHMHHLLEKSNISPEEFIDEEEEKQHSFRLAPRVWKLLHKYKPFVNLKKRLDQSSFFIWTTDWLVSATKSGVDFSLGFDPTSVQIESAKKKQNITREIFRLFDENNLDPDKEYKQRAYLDANPTFNRTLKRFYPDHWLRRFCQRIVSPAYGKRFDGADPIPKLRDAFYVMMFLASVVVVIFACYVTPLYRKENFLYEKPWNWVVISDLVFTCLFSVEFIIKVIADGLIRTPNAYLRSPWDFIDSIVLISFWITSFGEIYRDFNLVVIVGEFRALRALRLLTVTRKSKEYFNYAVISGARKMLAAVLISMSVLLPFSIWGLHLFVGKLAVCTDGESTKAECTMEYTNTVFKWDIVSPKSYSNPTLNFDGISSSLSTLFQIISLEGWVDLLLNLMNIVATGQPASTFASPGNGIFVIIFIFCSIVIILNLFVSVIINNYSVQTGTAFLNDKQRAWYEVKRILTQVRPSKRKDPQHMNAFRKKYYNLVVQKNRIYTNIVSGFYMIHIIGLLIEFYPASRTEDNFRYGLTLLSSSCLTCDAWLTLYAMGPRLFIKNGWNISKLIVFTGAFVLSAVAFDVPRTSVYGNINKIFLVMVALFLIPRFDTFNQLLKYASASLPSLIALIYTWLVLFLVYAIALNQVFGLTKLGENTTGNINCRTVTKSLILLFRISFGEGWNYIMDDFRLSSPSCSTSLSRYSSDCGQSPSAYTLFISWNILSMYIFLNILVSVVINSFSYVYNSAGPHSLLTRDEIRKFKKSWSQFDPDGTGFLDPLQLQPFLSTLDGVLSYKIYGDKFSIANIKSQWITHHSSDPYDVHLDFDKLDEILATIDFNKVKERRRRYNRLIIEAFLNMVQTSDGPRIEFNKLLLQIGYYSRFQDSTCLTLEDFVKRYVLIQKINKVARKLKIEATIQMVLYRLRRMIGNLNNSDEPVTRKLYRRIGTEIYDQEEFYETHNDDYNPFNNNELYRSVSETSLNPFNDPFSDPLQEEEIVPPPRRKTDSR
ncbi:hypothetical protein OGAPHI_000060 [Ogataea philodendri]|uniref:Calcium-channel protein CCH1 n=1 Tax=Ogataea philodendri TaxID=1378263 RepID=A0A9P8PIA0_9ASCO|nr:uncharacterized protein OGAPHI_000060 [Ogataea philodendri]KAH3671874.1 hypothetical protein OGAPHI_000060 [Ogataea philodendri]